MAASCISEFVTTRAGLAVDASFADDFPIPSGASASPGIFSVVCLLTSTTFGALALGHKRTALRGNNMQSLSSCSDAVEAQVRHRARRRSHP